MLKADKPRTWLRTPWVFIPLALLVGTLVFVGAVSYHHLRYTGHTVPVEFSNDTVKLAGMLVKPGPGGPYPHAGHSLGSWKFPHRAGYIPGYLELIGDWAEARVSS